MGRNQGSFNLFGDQQGVTMILVAIVMLVIIGFAALAIDIGHLFVVRNELKNAADAGALAGARVLLKDDGSVNVLADNVAQDAATSNRSDKQPAEVTLVADVKRGHWSFATEQFTPNNSTAAIPLWDVTNAELDANPDFINAIWVQTWRQQSPALSFFARILGFFGFVVRDESVAYIGFVGSALPDDVDQPIAICKETIMAEDAYSCRTGRMINSGNENGQDPTSQNSGAWTDYSQVEPGENCSSPSNQSIRNYAGCNGEDSPPLIFGADMQVTNGMLQNSYDRVLDCWLQNSENGTRPWPIVLPVIECGGDRTLSGCFELRGVVALQVLWMTRTGTPLGDVPREMHGVIGDGGAELADFACTSGSTDEQCWDQFRIHYNLRQADESGSYVPWVKKTLYFLPYCEYSEPEGKSGGENFGIRAKIPVLVK